MAQQQLSSREQQLRHEWHNQKMTGIPNYSQWLEQKVIAAENDKNMMEMAAQKNFDLWQSAEEKLETWQYEDWAVDGGFKRAKGVLADRSEQELE